MKQTLLTNGYTEQPIHFSFTPKFYHQSKGVYYSKTIPCGKHREVEIGVLINPEYDSMEIYACDCVIGCCGNLLGIHPFSIAKIDQQVAEWIDYAFGGKKF